MKVAFGNSLPVLACYNIYMHGNPTSALPIELQQSQNSENIDLGPITFRVASNGVIIPKQGSSESNFDSSTQTQHTHDL